MPAKLYCKTGELAGASYTIDQEATIGRASENTIVLHPSIVSSQHAHIVFNEKEQCYFIHDLGSRNGTSVDGVEVTGPVRLGMLHVITFADELNFFFQQTPAASAKAPSKAPPAARPAPPSAAPSSAARAAPKQDMSSSAPPSAATENSGAHTIFGLNFGSLPTLDESSPPTPAAPDEPSVATEYGFLMDQMPAELSEPAQEDDDPDLVTQQAPAMPQLPQLEDAADEDDEDEAPRTHFWGNFEALPNLDSGALELSRQTPAGRTPTEEVPRPEKKKPSDVEDTEPEHGSFPTPLPAALSGPEPRAEQDAVDEEANTVFSWGAFALEIHKGDIEQRWFDLKPGETTVGRRRDNDIPIPHHSISRLHTIFVVRGNTLSVMDCGSKNHTIVNGKRLEPQVEHKLEPGTTVRFGPQFEATIHYR